LAFLFDRLVRGRVAEGDGLDGIDTQGFETRFREKIPELCSRSFLKELSEFCDPDFQVINVCYLGCLQVISQVSPHRHATVKCKFHSSREYRSYRSYRSYTEQHSMAFRPV